MFGTNSFQNSSSNNSLLNQNTNWTNTPNSIFNNKPSTQIKPGYQNNIFNNKSQNEDKIKSLENRVYQIEKELSDMKQKNNMDIIHEKQYHNINCSSCKKGPIIGNRFLCGNCNQFNVQYNLCEECIKNRKNLHQNNHFFIMIHDSNLWTQ